LTSILPQQNHQAALAAAVGAFLPQATQQAADLHNIVDHIPYFSDPSHLINLAALTPYAQALQFLPGGAANQALIPPTSLATVMAQLQHQQNQQHLNGLLNAAVSVTPNSTAQSAQNAAGNPPCSTLFVANLGSNVNEDEV
jgi:hypothetical protein